MLNLFPELLSYNLVAPFILRIVLGYLFINLGYLKITSENQRWLTFLEGIKLKPIKFFLYFFTAIEIIGGAMLIVGIFTQFAATILTIFTFGELYVENKEENLLKRNLTFYLLIFTISLSLIFSGAGFFAIDLPL